MLSQTVIHPDAPLNVIKVDKATDYMRLIFLVVTKAICTLMATVLRANSSYTVACLAHMCRKFIEAKGNNEKAGKADVAFNLIGKLYGIEQAIKNKPATEK